MLTATMSKSVQRCMNGCCFRGLICTAVAEVLRLLHLHHAHFPHLEASPFPKGMSGGGMNGPGPRVSHRTHGTASAQGIGLIEIQGRDASARFIVELRVRAGLHIDTSVCCLSPPTSPPPIMSAQELKASGWGVSARTRQSTGEDAGGLSA